MNGYGSKPLPRLKSIHTPRNPQAPNTKAQEPIPLRILSAARSPSVSCSPVRTP